MCMDTTTTRLAAERRRRGWTQVDLAHYARLSAADVSRIESGRMRPYPAQAARIAHALGIDVTQLLALVEPEGAR